MFLIGDQTLFNEPGIEAGWAVCSDPRLWQNDRSVPLEISRGQRRLGSRYPAVAYGRLGGADVMPLLTGPAMRN
jgi:hypothetical protein